MIPNVPIQQVGLQDVKRNWGWYLALGILLILFGVIAIGRACLFTTMSMVFIGWLMIFAGVAQAFHAFWKERGWGGFFLDLLMGILYVAAGFMIVANPQATALALTLLIGMFLIFEGLFRMVSAIAVRFPNWGWLMLNGVISLLLGIMIWRQWPLSGVWVIGLFIGIQMIFNGWSLVMLGLTAKNLPLGGESSLSPAT